MYTALYDIRRHSLRGDPPSCLGKLIIYVLLFVIPITCLPLFVCLLSPTSFTSSTLQCVCVHVRVRVLQENTHCKWVEAYFPA